MKILIASFTFSPNMDGVAESARLMLQTFRRAGHEVLVATTKGASPGTSELGIHEGVRRFDISGAPALGAGFHGEIDHYQSFLRTFNPDVIVFHGWDTWPVELAIPVLPRLKAKSVLFSHGYACHLLDFKILPKGLYKWLRWLPHVAALPWHLRHFDKVVFLSAKRDLDRFYDAWIAKKSGYRNSTVIANGIDTSGWESIPANFRESQQLNPGMFFLCVANYAIVKNQKMALEAYLMANIPDSTFVFIGTSLAGYGERIREMWNQSKAAHPKLDVRFLEHVSREQVVSAIRSCDIAVLASKTEAQPLTLLEAMACGKPFIATDVGCVSELRGGIVVRDAESMAAQMRLLAADADQRASLGETAKRCFESYYSSEVTSIAWLNLIDELAQPNSSIL